MRQNALAVESNLLTNLTSIERIMNQSRMRVRPDNTNRLNKGTISAFFKLRYAAAQSIFY